MSDKVFNSADILLPAGDFGKWAVVACDQFTSEPDYWNQVADAVGNAPSALNIILPELYLEDNREERIDSINKTMQSYIENGVFKEYKDAMIYVERTQSDGLIRHGIVGAINLCDYDYHKGSKALIRATEETVASRIPPRVQIRRDACLEMPHVLLLVDDPMKTVIEPLRSKSHEMEKVYDFKLMLGGGHIKGWLIPKDLQSQIEAALSKLLEASEDKMMFAVGDGNHSLATAKECSLLNGTERSKSALVEVVNIHDDAIQFEPIYRVVFGVALEKMVADMKAALGEAECGHKFEILSGDSSVTLTVNATSKLPVGTLQTWLDKYVKENDLKIDYIHGVDSVKKIVANGDSVGFIFDGMQKDELFDAVKLDGSLPRKTFSMGHAEDKRYYIEARKL
ncbi:MAG: DUF1015 domain-containing protein [Ruminococcaceae bacterium]|nr:DUF1015 domain-containing protein [Oscillospiraceae bacterium]